MSPPRDSIQANPSSPNLHTERSLRSRPTSQNSHLSSKSLPPDLESAPPSPSSSHRHHPLKPGFTNAPPFRDFLRKNWYDIMTQLLCLACSLSIYHLVPPIMPRYFPYYPGIENTPWGMAHSKPIIKEYIDTMVSATLSFLVPALVMGAIALWGTRRFEDGNAAIMGLGYALSTSTLFICLTKILIGGLRPHFLAACRPSIPPSLKHKKHFTPAQICTGSSKQDLKEAQMSFPSGHSSAAFAGFFYLALWLNAHYKIFSPVRGGFHGIYCDPYTSLRPMRPVDVGGDKVLASKGSFENSSHPADTRDVTNPTNPLPHPPTTPNRTISHLLSPQHTPPTPSPFTERSHHWKLIVFAFPLLIALIISASKVRDMWHHVTDVVFGAMVGILFAHAGYKMCYRSVWDWRDNHVPLCEWDDGDRKGEDEGKEDEEGGEKDGKDGRDERDSGSV